MFRAAFLIAISCVVGVAACGEVSTTPTDAPAVENFLLTVAISGGGTGAVASAPAGITCGSDCTESYPQGTVVTLTATPGSGSTFMGWSGGGCTGTGTCAVTLTAATTVTATFVLDNSLTVTLAGGGTGGVTSSPAGIDCGADCTEVYPAATVVTLTATATGASAFAGWSGGGCAGTGSCVVTLDDAVMVTATFPLNQFLLSVVVTGTGAGTVSSAPAGIDCGTDCSEPYDTGTVVTLTATPTAGSTFTGWSGGGCSGTGACTTTVTTATAVAATFTLGTNLLTVARTGTGAGNVTSSPTGINCGADCTESYSFGTVVTLAATPTAGSTFAGWSGGGCSGAGSCVVTVTAATSVTATFTLTQHTLTVARIGNGNGTVVSSPAGINCGADCTETYNFGTTVVLTATPSAGSTFAGWSGGGCTGTGTCSTTITAATTVTPTFSLTTHALTVARNGTGSGTVTSAPTGINCGTDCTEPFTFGTTVVLTATPAAGSAFTGWSGGGCTGTGTCSTTITAATTVTATFTQVQFPLTVTRAGAGTGTVTSAPAGITCGNDCSESYASGTVVVLTATPAAGSSFTGWSGGGCTGTGTCSTTITAAVTITATFTLGGCDTFTTGNTTTIPNWTERAGDWLIEGQRLRNSVTANFYANVITMNGSTQGNGCGRLRAAQTPPSSVQSVGVVLRWTAPMSYVVALVQENAGGTFDTLYIYEFPAGTSLATVTGLALGPTPAIEACVTGSTVTLRADAAADGVYEHVITGTTSIAAPGLTGVMTHSFTNHPFVDNFCWGP